MRSAVFAKRCLCCGNHIERNLYRIPRKRMLLPQVPVRVMELFEGYLKAKDMHGLSFGVTREPVSTECVPE